MFEFLEIENLQSHKSSRFEFDPGLNAIIGPSDYGKSVVIRALDLLINNDWEESFPSHWIKRGDCTRVALGVDGHVVERIKSKSINEYRLDGEVFKAFGQRVPEEISKILNISDINIQRQIELPFLLTATSGEVARYLNKVVNLDILDIATSNLKGMKNKANSKLSIHSDDLKNKQTELKQKYSDLDVREKDIQKLEEMERESNQLRQSLIRLNGLINEITRESQALVPLITLIGAEEEVDRLMRLSKEVEEDGQRLRTLHYLIDEIFRCEEEIEVYSEIKKAEKEVNRLLALSEEIEELRHRHSTLTGLIRLIEETEAEVRDRQESIVAMVKEFNEMMPDICPLLDEPCLNLEKRKK